MQRPVLLKAFKSFAFVPLKSSDDAQIIHAVIAANCSMLRLLTDDVAQSVLLPFMMRKKELACMLRTCRLWHHWILFLKAKKDKARAGVTGLIEQVVVDPPVGHVRVISVDCLHTPLMRQWTFTLRLSSSRKYHPSDMHRHFGAVMQLPYLTNLDCELSAAELLSLQGRACIQALSSSLRRLDVATDSIRWNDEILPLVSCCSNLTFLR